MLPTYCGLSLFWRKLAEAAFNYTEQAQVEQKGKVFAINDDDDDDNDDNDNDTNVDTYTVSVGNTGYVLINLMIDYIYH